MLDRKKQLLGCTVARLLTGAEVKEAVEVFYPRFQIRVEIFAIHVCHQAALGVCHLGPWPFTDSWEIGAHCCEAGGHDIVTRLGEFMGQMIIPLHRQCQKGPCHYLYIPQARQSSRVVEDIDGVN